MSSFRFQTVPTYIVEAGIANRLGALLRSHFSSPTRLCVVTDTFLSRSGLLAPALADLDAHGWEVVLIDDVVADPPEALILDAARRARDADVQVVLGLGGGSSMDVAKLLSVLVPSSQPIGDMYGINKIAGARLPLVQMPTTAGTGSEMTAVSIVTTGETTKSGVVAPQLYADLAILDAALTLGLPSAATAATGIDAMVHAIEAYTSLHLKNPMSDMLAIRALQMLSRNILKACEQGTDVAAREAMLFGAMLAGQAFSNSPVAAVHALAYPIGGIFHVPHGLSNALVLAPVLRFNAGHAQALYAEIAEAVIPGLAGDAAHKTQALITWVEELVVATRIPRTLREVGVKETDLPRMARDAMLQTRLLGNNPRPLTEADALAIYQAAY